MATDDKKTKTPKGPSPESMYDYDFLDKPMNGYPPNTLVDLGDGEPVDLSKVPDPFKVDKRK